MGLPDLPGQNNDDGNFCMGEDIVINVETTSDDSENESVEDNEYTNGYQPLSLNDGNDMVFDDDDDDEDHDMDMTSPPGSPQSSHVRPPNREFLNLDVWNAPRPDALSIELDPATAEQIVNVMAEFKLPNTSVPEWAEGIPEERWKEDLLQRIRQRQHTCLGDEKDLNN